MLQCVLVLFECFIVFRVSCKELGNMFIIIIILLCSQQSLSDTWMVMVGTTWMGWDGMRDREWSRIMISTERLSPSFQSSKQQATATAELATSTRKTKKWHQSSQDKKVSALWWPMGFSPVQHQEPLLSSTTTKNEVQVDGSRKQTLRQCLSHYTLLMAI